MIRRKCAWCEKYMYFKLGSEITKFCSPLCYRLHREKLFTKEDDGPPMPPLAADRITDEGYIALVKAIVSRASDDVTHFSPGTPYRVSAEKFFESEFFGALTGLEGETILRKLQMEYEEKHKHRKPNYSKCPVRCVETGNVYESIKAAAEAFGITPKHVYNICNGYGKTAGGMHWEYVKEG